MTITVVNMRYNTIPVDFNCDRRSPLGNPYRMTHEKYRDHVCDNYEEYFPRMLNPDVSPPGFLEFLSEILEKAKKEDITIGCWRAPKRCHCDTIKNYVEGEIQKFEYHLREMAWS